MEYALECGEFFEVRILYDEFLRPNYDLRFAEELVGEILTYDPGLLRVREGHGRDIFMLAPTERTEDFLEAGGFMDNYVKEEEKWDTFLDQLSNAKLPPNPVAKVFKPAAMKREKYLLSMLISAVALSFLFTLVSIFRQTFLEPDYVPADEFERKIEQLELQYIQENQRLKTQLDQVGTAVDSLNF